MEIDEFLDREIKSQIEGTGKIGEIGLKLKQPDITEEIGKYLKSDDYPEKIRLALEKGDFEAAEKLYYESWAMLSSVEWSSKIYDDLIKMGDEMRNALNQVYSETAKKKAFVQEMLDKARANIAQGSYQAALRQYSELTDMHNEIPSFLFEEKRKMHKDILSLYMELKEKIDFVFLSKFNSSLSQIRQLINSAKLSLKGMDMEMAKGIYSEIIRIYSSLPAGFLSAKIFIANDILQLYKEISISLEIRALEIQLGAARAGAKITEPEKTARIRQQLFVEAAMPKARSAAKREIENLRELSLQRKMKLSKHGADAIKRLSTLPKTKRSQADLKGMLIRRRMERARLRVGSGNYSEAKKDFESVLRLDPDNAEAKGMLSRIIQR